MPVVAEFDMEVQTMANDSSVEVAMRGSDRDSPGLMGSGWAVVQDVPVFDERAIQMVVWDDVVAETSLGLLLDIQAAMQLPEASMARYGVVSSPWSFDPVEFKSCGLDHVAPTSLEMEYKIS